MDLLASILYDTVYHAAPIILCVIGGVFAYQANVLNIALEGMMGIGAFASTLTVYFTNSLVLGLLAGVLAALFFWRHLLSDGRHAQGKRNHYWSCAQPCDCHCWICHGKDERRKYFAIKPQRI